MIVQRTMEAMIGLARESGIQPASHAQETLRMVGVSKVFGATVALDAVDFDLLQGECHVLFGENGAGKSTLIQILAGVHRPTAGQVYHQGSEIQIRSVQDSRSLGISAVFQEFSIVPSLTVMENLFLGAEPTIGTWLDKRRMRRDGRVILDRFGFELDLDRPAVDLSRAEMQILEIARAFRTQPSVLILDEPTASLTESESGRLFELIGRLKEQRVGIIYITHRMHEIWRLGDRVTVLRDGRLISTTPIANATVDGLVSLMTGKSKTELFPTIRRVQGEKKLEVRNLKTSDSRVNAISFTVNSGEIVGIAGLMGSGKGEVGPACLGASFFESGEILLNGVNVAGARPREVMDKGLCYVPSDRRADGLFLQHGIRGNITIASLRRPPIAQKGFLNRNRENRLARETIRSLSVRPPNLELEVDKLSGGNQQKVMFGRFIALGANVYMFDEPTVGVDVGARRAIYEQLKNLCEAGAAILLISSDLSEILNLCHRSYVMHRGKIMGERSGDRMSEQELLHLMFGETLAAAGDLHHGKNGDAHDDRS